MIAIVMLDDRKGMMFNHRRQSRDGRVIRKILEVAGHGTLRMSPYTSQLFEGMQSDTNIIVSDTFLDDAEDDDFCVIEEGLSLDISNIKKLVVFWWNREYPGDVFFDIDLEDGNWFLENWDEFPGTSHEKITMEIYGKVQIKNHNL